MPGGWSSENLADAVEQRTGFRALIDMSRVHADLVQGKVMQGNLELTSLDGILIKKIGADYGTEMLDRLEVLRMVAESGVPVFSHPLRILRVLNRLTCTVTLRSAGIPMPPTFITEDADQAVDTIERYEQAVLKPLFSSKARGMRVVAANGRTDVRAAVREFQSEGNRTIYVQKKLEVPGRDLGVAFLGGQHFGTYARVRAAGAWDTTTRSGGQYAAHQASAAVIELARRAQEPFHMDFTSVDVVETDDGPVVFEVSAFGGFRGLQQAAGLNAATAFVDHAIRRIRG